MTKLALHGGAPVRSENFPAYNVIGEDEIASVAEVLGSGILSKYLGAWHPDFFGGPVVQNFEEAWAERTGAKHVISVNSATSGLYAACGALGLGEGDEVIVSPYTMSASAAAPLVYGASPVFADIDPETFCLTEKTISEKISPKTKAIIVVHLFGRTASMGGIMRLANKHGIRVIEDCAQSPSALFDNKHVGTIGDIGVFSLNYHKHIHTGEGGLVTTNCPNLADRLQLIRNHAEAVVDAKQSAGFGVYEGDLLGFNYRLGEVEAAIGLSLIKKLDRLIEERLQNVHYLEERLSGIPFLSFPKVLNTEQHNYYVHPILFDEKACSVSRAAYVAAVKAELPPCRMRENEGVLISYGYVRPLYEQSIYRHRKLRGLKNASDHALKTYEFGSCPNCEYSHRNSLITHELMRPGFSNADLDDVVAAFWKVAENLGQI